VYTLAAAIALLGVLAGCVMASMTPAQRLVSSKCGACHTRPAPGGRTEARARTILRDHARRFDLSQDQMRLLKDYLSGKSRH
jgi:hypothetical protein